MESHLPKLAKPHFYMIYYRIIIYLLSNAVYMVNFGRACNHAALGEPSSHAKRELLMADYHNFFITNFPMTARLTRQTKFALRCLLYHIFSYELNFFVQFFVAFPNVCALACRLSVSHKGLF